MGAEFIAEEGSLRGLILALKEGEQWVIGRDPDQADLVIEDLKASRRHVLCSLTSEGYIIENLSETNPVYVNEELLQKPTLLHAGDRVAIGGTVFRFYPQEGMRSVTSEFEATAPQEAFPPMEEIKQEEFPEVHFDLTGTNRFLFKVISGPNAGAEFALDLERDYLIGTDTDTCDIVFHDLSVSREHARLRISKEGVLTVQDLNSRNGVIVDRERIYGSLTLLPNVLVTLGTSSFIIIDKEAPSETIATPLFEEKVEEFKPPEMVEEVIEKKEPIEAVKALPAKGPILTGNLLLALIIGGLVVLFGVGVVSLFSTTSVEVVQKDFTREINEALKPFPAVKYTYNPNTNKLFLVGHVSTGVQKNELLYNLQGLPYLKGIEDNVVVDESVWQEMNLLLSQRPEFQGVTMHSPYPGRFVLSGYLKTLNQSSSLKDYMNLHFNYLDRLENRVVVDEEVIDRVESRLVQDGFNGVTPSFANGDLVLTGYISAAQAYEFQSIVNEFTLIQGIRNVHNYVVGLSPEKAVVDLNEREPGKYLVTGYSRHGDVNVNVVVNGKILTRGAAIDGMIVTSIQPHTIFLEKDGLKYKIEYNK